ncbi:MAG: GMC family oxidoreductase N-terminal domain-containing protein [Betaproteobacteria bacterium]|nr:GMC family oxidoreductase N-terminal domain-containing protein [Betaproteobacteria bacterium]
MQTTFDYLILGGGSAGCALANRLSEDPAVSVALVEAGREGRDALIRTPAAVVAMAPTKINNYAYETVPQAGLNGRVGYQPRGRALGGSSAINAMVYIRGDKTDYDHWAALGNPGWSYDDVLPYFKRSEHNERLNGHFHGQGGPLNVTDRSNDGPFPGLFLEAAQQAGHMLNSDFNGASMEGAGYYQVTHKGGERCSAARAYVHPLMEGEHKRDNLTVVTRAEAERLTFEGRRATGAFVRVAGQRLHLTARREVIVSCGAIRSPQLLMVSGIGAGADLQALGIPVLHDLPGVGANLQDHPDFIFGHAVTSLDLVGFTPKGFLHLIREWRRYRKSRTGLWASNYAEAGAFLKLRPDSPAPDVQLHFVIALVEDHARRFNFRHGVSCHVCLLRPRSRGSIRLASHDPFGMPLIDPAFFADPQDLEDMVAGYKLTRALLVQPALSRLYEQDMFTAGVASDDDIRAVIRNRADTVYHPVGSCKMGTDPMAVVDPELRVHGLVGLRVVDASIMPTLIGGNTNAPAIMIGEKAADLIRRRRA